MFPLVAAVLALIAGMLPGLRFGGPEVLLALAGAGAACAGLFLAKRTRGPGYALLAAFALCGAAYGANTHQTVAQDCRVLLPDDTRVRLRGVLAANVRVAERGASRPAVPVRALTVEADGRPLPACTGEMSVRVPHEAAGLRAGAEVVVRGRWASASSPVLASAWPKDPRFAGAVRADSVSLEAPPSLAPAFRCSRCAATLRRTWTAFSRSMRRSPTRSCSDVAKGSTRRCGTASPGRG